MSTISIEVLKVEDLVRGVFAVWGKKHPDDKMPIMSIYSVFSKLAEKHPDRFRDLHFVTYNGKPFSRRLEQILFDLGTWGVISIENPRYEYYKVKENAPGIIINLLSKEYQTEEGSLERSFAELVEEFDNLRK